MSEDMNLSINGESQVPPGFRFHPTEEELLHYYLTKKVAYQKIDLDVIPELDLNKLEPWDIQDKCRIGSTPQNDWYFFSHKDKKYPTGTRTNRATAAGFWKATGRDKIIYSSFRRIGLRKTLVFYKGRAPHGQKSDWIMHEYRLDDNNNTIDSNASNPIGDSMAEEGWVVCRVFRKKNYQKTLESPKSSSSTSLDSKTMVLCSGNDGALDQMFMYIGRTGNLNIPNTTTNNNNNYLRMFVENNSGLHESFMHLPRLESPPPPPLSSLDRNRSSFNSCFQSLDDMLTETEPSSVKRGDSGGSGGDNHHRTVSPVENNNETINGVNDWVTLDRLVASQLNGQVETTSKQLSCFSDDPKAVFSLCHDDDVQLSHINLDRSNQNSQAYSGENDLWSLTKSSSPSSSDPLCHLSV